MNVLSLIYARPFVLFDSSIGDHKILVQLQFVCLEEIRFSRLSIIFAMVFILLAKQLQCGELIGREHLEGLTLLKWKDKRDFIGLSTKHSTEVVITKVGHRL